MTLGIVDGAHPGTDPAVWAPILSGLRRWDDTIAPAAGRSRLIVISPHPDDETLGVGGYIADTARTGGRVVVISVTDGEAAASTMAPLSSTRRRELSEALALLSPTSAIPTIRYGLPDGGVHLALRELAEMLGAEIRSDDFVLGPLPNDGHSDHNAVGEATRLAARRAGATYAFYPIWAWHWHTPTTSEISRNGWRVDLSNEAISAKSNAIRCFASQTAGAAPVLPSHFLARFAGSCEVIVADVKSARRSR